MSKRRKSVLDDVLPAPSPIEITDSQECIPSNHDEVFNRLTTQKMTHSHKKMALIQRVIR